MNLDREIIQSVLGRPSLTGPELIRRLADEGWPKVVVLHPIDFMSILSAGGAPSCPRSPEGVAYFYLANCRIECQGPEDKTLDLSRPALIVTPTIGGIVPR